MKNFRRMTASIVPDYKMQIITEAQAKKILKKFSQEYDFLYKHEDNVAGYSEAVAAYDDFIDNKTFERLIQDCVNVRSDFFSSDREVGAFMFALDAMGVLDAIDARASDEQIKKVIDNYNFPSRKKTQSSVISKRHKVLSELSTSDVKKAAQKEGLYYLTDDFLNKLTVYINKYDTLLDVSYLNIKQEIKNYLENFADFKDVQFFIDNFLQEEFVFNLDSDTISEDFKKIYYNDFLPDFTKYCIENNIIDNLPKNRKGWTNLVKDYKDNYGEYDYVSDLNDELDSCISDKVEGVYGDDYVLNLYGDFDFDLDINSIQYWIRDAYIRNEPDWLETLRKADKHDLEDAIVSAMRDNIDIDLAYNYYSPFDRYLENGKLLIEDVSIGELEIQLTDTGLPICEELLDLRNNYTDGKYMYINREGDSVCYSVNVDDVLKYLKGNK